MTETATLTRRAFLRDLAALSASVAGVGLLTGCTPTVAPVAQPPARTYRIGLLATGPAASASPSAAPDAPDTRSDFWSRLAELGYVEGQNLTREERFATLVAGAAPFDALAAELVRLPVDIIAVGSAPAASAAIAATTLIPIVLISVNDPVALGFVESLAQPGRNVTGTTNSPAEMDLKRVQLLVEAVPGVARIGVLGEPPDLSDDPWKSAAESLGVEFILLPDPSRDGFEPVLQYAVARQADALLTRVGFATTANAPLIGGLAARYRLPGIARAPGFVTGGGLMSYEVRTSEVQRHAADYVDRILRGARPADLPVELPTRYDLTVNLSAARELGLALPAELLAQADEVIE